MTRPCKTQVWLGPQAFLDQGLSSTGMQSFPVSRSSTPVSECWFILFRCFHTMGPHPSIWTKDKGDALFSNCKDMISWFFHFQFETFSSNFKLSRVHTHHFGSWGWQPQQTPRVREESCTKQGGGCQRSWLNVRTEVPSMSSTVFLAVSTFPLAKGWLGVERRERKVPLCHVGLRMIFSTFNISLRRHDQFSTGMLCGSI